MRSPADMACIQIEVTNKCTRACANCTRLVGHHREPFFMSLADVRKAIVSLDGFKGNIGLMGGEPTLHPDFLNIPYAVVLNKMDDAAAKEGIDEQSFDPGVPCFEISAQQGEGLESLEGHLKKLLEANQDA